MEQRAWKSLILLVPVLVLSIQVSTMPVQGGTATNGLPSGVSYTNATAAEGPDSIAASMRFDERL